MTAPARTVHYLGPTAAIPPGEGRAYDVAGTAVAIFRLRDDRLHAMAARCPHAGGPLADGQTDRGRVVCPLHARSYAFADGSCDEGPPVAVYSVRDEAGQIVVELPN